MSDYVEPPRISSTLRWEEVSLPSAVRIEDLDAVIFAMLKPRSSKTARIIGDVVEAFRNRSIALDPEIVGARIQLLVDDGSIEALGNPRKWRHSELLTKGA
jgi:hypothetical protein